MREVKVALGANSYGILVGAGLLGQVGSLLKAKGFAGKLVVITDPTVDRLYGATLRQGLGDFRVATLFIPEGEEQKSLENASRLYQELTDNYAERGTPVLALGGGVIGDLSGFVAATYLRGVPFIQVPTTLVAQVDSSIGGKTAVDYGRLKNRIGAFHQPKLVISDVEALKKLPEKEMANGLAEVIKTAAIRDEDLFKYLEENIDGIKARDTKVLEKVVSRCAGIKAEVVEKDEHDLGIRAILNYGHTIGHALETVSGFGIGHGQAVAFGMVIAARISRETGVLDSHNVDRLESLIKRAGLPTAMTGLDVEAMLRAMKHDKKVQNEKVRFVLLKSIGNAFISEDVAPELVRRVLEGND